MANTKKAAKSADAKKPTRYTKESILVSNRFRDNRDLLSVLLEDDKSYSIEECSEFIDNYMKGKVE